MLRHNDGSMKLSIGLRNTGTAPIKAFRAKVLKKNDFGEGKNILDLEYSSESEYITGHDRFNRHVLLANELIFYNLITYSSANSQTYFSPDSCIHSMITGLGKTKTEAEEAAKEMLADGSFILQVASIVNESTELARQSAEQECLRREKQEKLAQQMAEQDRLKQEEIAHQAEEDRRIEKVIEQSTIPTREIARIQMAEKSETFVITDVSVIYRGALYNFERCPNFQANGLTAIVDDGSYYYFANQVDRDKALSILGEAVKAWEKKFPEAVKKR